MVRTLLLLTASNVFMTFAWYYHLKHQGWPLWKAIVLSWFIALFEYLLMVPANRLGYASGWSESLSATRASWRASQARSITGA